MGLKQESRAFKGGGGEVLVGGSLRYLSGLKSDYARVYFTLGPIGSFLFFVAN